MTRRSAADIEAIRRILARECLSGDDASLSAAVVLRHGSQHSKDFRESPARGS